MALGGVPQYLNSNPDSCAVLGIIYTHPEGQSFAEIQAALDVDKTRLRSIMSRLQNYSLVERSSWRRSCSIWRIPYHHLPYVSSKLVQCGIINAQNNPLVGA